MSDKDFCLAKQRWLEIHKNADVITFSTETRDPIHADYYGNQMFWPGRVYFEFPKED